MSRRLSLLLAPLVVLALNAGCASSVSPALEVGSTKVGNDDFLDEVEEWAGNEGAVDKASLADQPEGSLPHQLVAAILFQRIDLELHRIEFERLDLEITDEARQATAAGIESQVQGALEGFSESFAESYVDDEVRRDAVRAALAEDYPVWREEALRTTAIEVNPRYGSWDAEQGMVVPPEGPTDPGADSPLELGS
ncbi:MAG: hypothetical protein M3Z03_12365 [Actinomycetota bacterium]|nr:hypothetical protein [Actinomycetota bacterium]